MPSKNETSPNLASLLSQRKPTPSARANGTVLERLSKMVAPPEPGQPLEHDDLGVQVADKFGNPWQCNEITYNIAVYSSDSSHDRDDVAARRAFDMWEAVFADVGEDFSFKNEGGGDADIQISFFGDGDHGCTDEEMFDLVGGKIIVLGHTYCPFPDLLGHSGHLAGDIHLNNNIFGDLVAALKYDLTSVLAHEIGHALGLAHNESMDSVMFNIYQHPFTELITTERGEIIRIYVEQGEIRQKVFDHRGGGIKPGRVEAIG